MMFNKRLQKALKSVLRTTLSITISTPLAAFSAGKPHAQDLIQLNADFNARRSGQFLSSSNNIVRTFKKGTKAEIIQRKYFPQTGNYGLCLKPYPNNGQECLWVYYRSKSPAIKLYHVSESVEAKNKLLTDWGLNQKSTTALTPTTDPKRANAALTTSVVPTFALPIKSVVESALQELKPTPFRPTTAKTSSTVGADEINHLDNDIANPQPSPQVSQQVTEQIALQADKLNQNLRAVTSGAQISSTCKDCKVDLKTYPRCQASNSYLLDDILHLSKDPKLSFLFASNQPEMIRASCVQRSMDQYPSSSQFFRDCAGGSSGKHHVPKACTNENYVELTANSFNLAARCLSPEITGSSDHRENQEMSLQIFQLLTHESGLHMNATSHTSAAGPGQMTDDGISGANKRLKYIRNRLTQSKDPGCQQLAQILEKPLKADSKHFCDRISSGNGNPLKGMAYAFLYQYTTRDYLDSTVYDTKMFQYLIQNLSVTESARLKGALQIWAHNTGTAGMKVPLQRLVIDYVRQHKKIADVDRFLKELESTMRSHPAIGNRKRTGQTSKFYAATKSKMQNITTEAQSCLAQ